LTRADGGFNSLKHRGKHMYHALQNSQTLHFTRRAFSVSYDSQNKPMKYFPKHHCPVDLCNGEVCFLSDTGLNS
jgi:hypothetical protein